MSGLNEREKSLVSLGASIASNCQPCIEYHIPGARQAGLSEAQIEEAVRIADRVRRVPANAILKSALAKIGDCPDGSGEQTASGCGCSENDKDDESCR